MEISSPKKRYGSLGSYGTSTRRELSLKEKPEAHRGEEMQSNLFLFPSFCLFCA